MQIVKKQSSLRYSNWFLVPAFLTFAMFFVLPNLVGFILSFTDWNIFFIDKMKFNGIENFELMIRSPILKTALINTIIYTLATSFLKNLFGFILAIVVSRKLLFTKFYKTVFFLPILVSTMVVGIVFTAIYNPQTGLLNQALRAIGLDFLAQEWLVDARFALGSICAMDIWQGTGVCMVIYFSGIQGVDKSYYESAEIDGASYMQRVCRITIPLIMPAVNISTLMCLISGLKAFAQVMALTNGGPADKTQVFSTLIYKSFAEGLLGYSAAVGLVFSIVVSIASFIILGFMRKFEVEM